jgi:2-keto-4-pentenoate hydratase/2-oxohepta-3-ene-1,7-dioic acid hydratase in catechol pathway
MDDSQPRLGIANPGPRTVRPIEGKSSTTEALASGETWNSLRDSASDEEFDLDNVSLQAPVQQPVNLIGVGLNYAGHAKEGGHEVPDEPVFFAKSPSSIVGPDSNIVKNQLVSNLHYEGELAVIVGERIQAASPEQVITSVFGFTPANDVTARDVQHSDLDAGKPWYRSKSMDTFTPIGPWIAPRSDGFEPAELHLKTRLNGDAIQSATLSEQIFPVDEAISSISQFITLHPGDVVLTGTPAGIGEMNPGDDIEVTLEGIGTLRNTVTS